MTDAPMPDSLGAQVREAAEAEGASVHQLPVKPLTKMIMWRGQPWTVRNKPGARFLVEYEQDRIMAAVKSVVGDEQWARIMAFDPDIEGADGMDGFIEACNRAWGIGSGN